MKKQNNYACCGNCEHAEYIPDLDDIKFCTLIAMNVPIDYACLKDYKPNFDSKKIIKEN